MLRGGVAAVLVLTSLACGLFVPDSGGDWFVITNLAGTPITVTYGGDALVRELPPDRSVSIGQDRGTGCTVRDLVARGLDGEEFGSAAAGSVCQGDTWRVSGPAPPSI